MTKSDSIANLASALVAAQGQFAPVKKTEQATIPTRNGGSFGYRYADLAQVIEATRPALLANGLAVLQFPSADQGRVSVTTVLAHTSGEHISETLTMPVPTDTPQAVGSGITYARRYSYLAVLGLAAEDDDGAAASKKAKEKTPTEPAGYSNWRLKVTLESRKGMPALRSLWNASPAQYRDHAMTADNSWWAGVKESVAAVAV